MARIKDIFRPFIQREGNINAAHNEWFQRELARPGATITGAAPDAVNEALHQNNLKRSIAARDFHKSQESDIRAEGAELVANARSKYAEALEAMKALRQFHRDEAAFASACGMPALPRLDEPNIEAMTFRQWDHKVNRVLNPPTPAPRMRAADNPLVLD